MPITARAARSIPGEDEYIDAIERLYYSPNSGKRWNDVDSLDRFLLAYGTVRTLPPERVRRKKLTKMMQVLPRYMSKIHELKLEDADLDDSKLRRSAYNLYSLVNESLRTARVIHNPTAVGKILHVLQPELFVIWDNVIRVPRQFGGSFDEYWRYLKTARDGITEAFTDFKSKDPEATTESIEANLYESRLKPITKLYDEACWAMVQGWLHFH